MSGMLSTGSSALLAFQRALATVGNNVANAATPGYSRQRVEMESRPGETSGRGTVGGGVNVALATGGNNVANAAAPGDSRRRVERRSRPGETLGAGTVGGGVNAAHLQRLADGLVFARRVDSRGDLGRLQQLSGLSSSV